MTAMTLQQYWLLIDALQGLTGKLAAEERTTLTQMAFWGEEYGLLLPSKDSRTWSRLAYCLRSSVSD